MSALCHKRTFFRPQTFEFPPRSASNRRPGRLGAAISESVLLRSPQTKLIQSTKMWPRLPLVIVIGVGGHCRCRLIRHVSLGRSAATTSPRNRAGAAGSGYDNFAKQYARILARHRRRAGDPQLCRLPWKILIGCAIPPPGSRPPSRPSASRNRPMRISSIHWVEYSMPRYSFSTGTRSLLRFLRSCVASAFRSACREPPCDCLCWKF